MGLGHDPVLARLSCARLGELTSTHWSLAAGRRRRFGLVRQAASLACPPDADLRLLPRPVLRVASQGTCQPGAFKTNSPYAAEMILASLPRMLRALIEWSAPGAHDQRLRLREVRYGRHCRA